MDANTSTAYNILERLLIDGSEAPRQLPLSLLEAITNNFSDDMRIGSGGFAVVYKGMVGSQSVAVKKFSQAMDMNEKQFIKEVQCLMKVRHKNIVRFLGYCADTQGLVTTYRGESVQADVRNRALCFEYVPQGSLDKHITGACCGLEWRVRYQMIKGISEGLHYLHENRILHLDLKPANILVDDNMVPKIADFGLSRLFEENQSKVITTTLVGSLGYFAPEYYSGIITFKLDIYSLGVVIMEILTGKKLVCAAEEVLMSWRNRLEISQEDLQQVKACAEIGIKCMETNPANRPTTQDMIKTFNELGGTSSEVQGIPCGGANRAAAAGACYRAGVLDHLAQMPQFQKLLAMVRANPQILEPMLQELGKQNPLILQLILDNQDEFLGLLNEESPNNGTGGNIHDQPAPATPHALTVTQEEFEAIQRLEAMGFTRELVLEVFFACNKGEELAAKYLLDEANYLSDEEQREQ